MPKGDNMSVRGQRKTRLKKLLSSKDGETAMWAVTMLALMDGDLQDDEHKRYERANQHLTRRAAWSETKADMVTEDGTNLFA
jgi:hypothetical protein